MPETYSPDHQPNQLLPSQELDYPPEYPGASSLRSRLLTTRLGRGVITTLAAASLYTGIGVANASSAEADAGLVYEVGNTDGGVFSRNSPRTNDTPRIVGQGAYDGDKVELLCGVTNGDAVGPYSNNTWHYAKNLSRPSQPLFWISDRHVMSPNRADTLAPGEKECNEQTTPPKPPEQPGCYFNFKWEKRNLTFSYEGDHRYYGNAWQAARNWTELNAGISITPAPEGQQGDIVFKDVYKEWDERYGLYYGRTIFSDNPSVHSQIEDGAKSNKYPISPLRSSKVTVELNQYLIEDYAYGQYHLDDKGRTYTATHELGHALGIAHPEDCGIDSKSIDSIMEKGTKEELVMKKPYNKPQGYDIFAIKALYGLRGVDNTLGNYA